MTRKPSRFLSVEIGDEYDRLTVISKPWKCPRFGQWKVRVKCKCGTVKDAIIQRMVIGNVRSCGCLNKERHSRFCVMLKVDAMNKGSR